MDVKIMVSACLMGIKCRYDGRATDDMRFPAGVEPVPFCPEVYGGLTTPRRPSEIVDGRVMSDAGEDVTAQYERGAEEAVALCRRLGIRVAVMQDRSPSCGAGIVHNGRFDGGLTEGDGVAARRLKEAGVRVIPASKAREDMSLLLEDAP